MSNIYKEARKVLHCVEYDAQLASMTEYRCAYEEQSQIQIAYQKLMMFVQPSLSRDCSAQIPSVVAYAKDEVPIQMLPDFTMDTACEWAYVVDLDKEVFEIYFGCCSAQEGVGRFDDEDFVRSWAWKNKLAFVIKHGFDELEGMTVNSPGGRRQWGADEGRLIPTGV